MNFKNHKDIWFQIGLHCISLLLFCFTILSANAQSNNLPSVRVGDPAPPLQVREWLKGTPVHGFVKGHVYVVEFWATWCKPCIAAMPHLSELAKQNRDKATFIGMDVYESNNTPLKKLKAFVDSMGQRMDYTVAAEDSNFMVAGWIEATGEQDNGIPRTFVVDAEGRLAWIGHPKELADVLPKIVNKTWDIKEELARKEEEKYIFQLADSLRFELNKLTGDAQKPGDLGRPDSALFLIHEMLKKEPKLRYTSPITFHTFSALLRTNPSKAYAYGKDLLVTSTYANPVHNSILGPLNWYSNKLEIPTQLYELGAETYQLKINRYPETINIPNNFRDMALMYYRAKNKVKAIDAMQKAIDALKSKNGYSGKDMADFESRLKQYKDM